MEEEEAIESLLDALVRIANALEKLTDLIEEETRDQ